MPKKQRLRVSEIMTVGFVDKGDDPEAEIIFYKSRPEEIDKKIVRRGSKYVVMDEAGKKVLGEHDDMASAQRQLAAIDRKKGHAMKNFLKAVATKLGMQDEEIEELLADGADGGSNDDGGPDNYGGGQMTFDVNNLDEAQKAAFEQAVEDAVAKRLADGSDENDQNVDLDEVPESIAKAFESMEKRLGEAESRANAAEEIVQKMKDEQERQTYIRKAKALDLPGANPDDFAEILRKAESSLSDEEREKFEEIMRSASAAASIGLQEAGRPGAGSDSLEAEVADLAKAYKKENPSLTDEMARAKVWQNHPQLYRKYRDEHVSNARGED